MKTYLHSSKVISNDEFTNFLSSEFSQHLTVENCIQVLSFLHSSLVASYVAKHFSLLKDQLQNLCSSDVYLILGDHYLAINSEDELLQFCISFFERVGDSSIFKFVYFSRVSISALKSFLDLVPLNNISSAWSSLTNRLLIPVDLKSNEYQLSPSHKYNKLKESFSSLIDYCSSHSLTLTAKGSSIYSSCEANYALIHGTQQYFKSQNIPNSWWIIDFGRQFFLESYSMLRNCPGSNSPCTLR